MQLPNISSKIFTNWGKPNCEEHINNYSKDTATRKGKYPEREKVRTQDAKEKRETFLNRITLNAKRDVTEKGKEGKCGDGEK